MIGIIEIVITVILITLAGYTLFKNLKKNASGKCNCGSCSSSCPKYNLDITDISKKNVKK